MDVKTGRRGFADDYAGDLSDVSAWQSVTSCSLLWRHWHWRASAKSTWLPFPLRSCNGCGKGEGAQCVSAGSHQERHLVC